MSSRAEAHEAIGAGRVLVDGAPALKPASQVHAAQALVLAAPARRFVSRGGEKLEAALDRFHLDVEGLSCLDAGASTGGFTDCLLQRGAAHVVAVDVGYGQLHNRLRNDERVTVLERTNVRELAAEALPGAPPDLVVGDLSFISLRLVLPTLREVAAPAAQAVLLVKPQFEAGRDDVGKGGVVREPDTWRRTIAEVADAGRDAGWDPAGVVPSPLTGPAGNVEFLLWFVPEPSRSLSSDDIDAAVSEASDGAAA